MASPVPRVGPSPASLVLLLLAAAVIGFLGGALIAVTTGTPAPTAPPGTSPPTASPTPSPTSAPPEPGTASLTLTADRDAARTGDLIRLEGRLEPARGGLTLQVQQAVDGGPFADFPVTAQTRSDGSFGVWVRTGRVGDNQFRMVAALEGESVVSDPVEVSIS